MDTQTPLHSKEIILTEEQGEAVDTLVAWTKDKQKFTAILKGSAGSGKTTTLKQFIKEARIRKIVVTAPTHKAKKVVANATGCNAITVHSLLGLRPDLELTEFDINNTIFSPIGLSKMADFDLVIIDESSMINSDLFDLLVSSSKLSRTKVLFVGDPLQLPPVKEEFPRALNEADVICHLNTIMRQSEANPCGNVLFNMRESIEKFRSFVNPDPISSFKYETGEGYEIYTESNKMEFFLNMKRDFLSENFENNPDFVKFVAFTNVRVTEANAWIRKQILENRGVTPDIICKGDIITGYRNVDVKISEDLTTNLITNSEDYYVEKVEIGKSNDLLGRYVAIKNIYFGTISNIFVVDPASYGDFLKLHDAYYSKTQSTYGRERGKAWGEYYAFKNNHLIGESLELPNSNGKKVNKDFDFAYAITVHKSQGTTFNRVYVDVNNIQTNRSLLMRNKLLYVAASRASHQIHLLNV